MSAETSCKGIDAARYFEDISIGEEATIEDARTITEADINNFAGVTGDFHPLHMSDPFAREETGFDGRIAHGHMTAAITEAIILEENRYSMSYGHDNTRFIRPVFPGDTLSVRREVIDKEEHDDEYGKVVYEYEATNQDGETVFVDHHIMLVDRRP